MMNFHIDVSLQEGKELNLVFWVEHRSRHVHNEPYQNLRLAEHIFSRIVHRNRMAIPSENTENGG